MIKAVGFSIDKNMLAGFLDVQCIHIRRLDGGFHLAVCHKFQIAR
ncbi:MAG: hypothetical protein ACOY16_08320 [Chloroflexota bacterium]